VPDAIWQHIVDAVEMMSDDEIVYNWQHVVREGPTKVPRTFENSKDASEEGDPGFFILPRGDKK